MYFFLFLFILILINARIIKSLSYSGNSLALESFLTISFLAVILLVFLLGPLLLDLTGILEMPMTGVRCPTCLANGSEV